MQKFRNWKAVAISAALALVFSSTLSLALFTSAVDRLMTTTQSQPAITSCGSGALATGSSDFAGHVATSTSGCVLTFGTAFATAPSCVVSDYTTAAALKAATTTTALTITGQTASDAVSYICVGKAGG